MLGSIGLTGIQQAQARFEAAAGNITQAAAAGDLSALTSNILELQSAKNAFAASASVLKSEQEMLEILLGVLDAGSGLDVTV